MRTSFLLPFLSAAALMAMPALATTIPAARESAATGVRLAQASGPSTVPQTAPQFNTPGQQLAIPEPGNPVQQLSPLGTTNPPSGSPVPELSPLGSAYAQPVNPLQQTSPLGSAVP